MQFTDINKTTILLIICLVPLCFCWDYIIFSQVWPSSWINHDKINYNFTNDYFTVHGLWPQFNNNSYPEFCKKSMFNVSEVNYIKNNLTKYWTDFKNPASFWKHEYEKHLICMQDTYKNIYILFKYGLQLREKINPFSLLKKNGIVPNNNVKYNVNDLYSIIKSQIGVNCIITCPNNILTEIRFCLTKQFGLFDCPKNTDYNEMCRSDKIIYLKL